MSDYLFRGSLADLDPELYDLTQIEAERQYRKLILIPSESAAPLAVREALGSAFQNIYAEGYPDEATRWLAEEDIFDYDSRLAHYRRYSDPRYYKGVEYADIVEALARRRCAETFAANGVSADEIYVNVQALSGGPANNAVYHALVNPGETIMGMDLLHGGHLSHGSHVNRSGKYYNAVHYTVDPETEQINYEAVEALAREHQPKFIIAGYSSYPWAVDWARFRAIADAVGAYLFADIAHVAGLVAAGVYPSPVSYADVITFTTHKSLTGPRGACILTTNRLLARKIDRAVFPGEQGGPHVNVFAAMALAFKLAQTDQFRQLQEQVVKNCITLTERLNQRGFKIPFGGTDTHLTNLDCSSVTGPDGTTLSGDQAARILDIAGVVVNRNTIPGDKSAVAPSGIRMGTPWVTQRGLKEAEMIQLADAIADVLMATKPFSLQGRKGRLRRAKVDFAALEEAKIKVRDLAEGAGIDFDATEHGYPHFYYLDDKPIDKDGWVAYDLVGERVSQFLDYAVSCDIASLDPGQSAATCLITPRGTVEGALSCVSKDAFRLSVPSWGASLASAWLRDLSDGYVDLDGEDESSSGLPRKLPGPIIIKPSPAEPVQKDCKDELEFGPARGGTKPYFIGIPEGTGEALPPFEWEELEGDLRRTPVYEVHQELGAKLIPFAGWEMPVWYTSVMDEHIATRDAAGLFDVAHMGVYQVEGPEAAAFLDSVCGNDIGGLDVGESCYTHFLTPAGEVIDDTLVYRRGTEKILVVVNASNDDKDWAWLNAVRDGTVRVDKGRPWAKAFGRKAILRNLRDPKEGGDMRVDIALQGPRSRDILLTLGCDDITRKRIMALKRTQLTEANLGSFDLVVSRTGYTGEKMAFELFVHPDRAAELFRTLLKAGEPLGIKPVGLGARDSLRTEAGLPLYGHEMGEGSGKFGQEDLGVAEGGFGSYVKAYKPWFIGREAYLVREETRKGIVVRFRFNEKGVRMAHNGDPVMDKRGRVIGWVTSCAVDRDGYLTGQAYVDQKNAGEGTPIYIYQSAPQKAGKAPAELTVGDRTTLATQALVVSRFLK
ncbi:MAG: glycine cleavage system aminomethyltransferase GcvT [Anaerolineales bacterium]|nr:glycine cleavage system aminomethyltransferase GcvT [Anaerolineales bacterium]